MSEFNELIKNFDRIRDYMRQFYVYGFKVRNDFDIKSTRTYDNERRRIESWLADYIKSDYTPKGKQVYINVDSRSITQNPLYAAWKSKSFTDNDLLLHFFILDRLTGLENGKTAGELCDEVSSVFGVVFDSQIVRLKLKEYEGLGILISERDGKNLLYRMAPPLPAEKGTDSLWKKTICAVKFFQGAAPFGFIGSTILDRDNEDNNLFQFKHNFIVHTLEDGVLADVITAMKEHRQITIENKSARSHMISIIRGIPLKIVVSTRTGRRYVCLYLPEARRFNNVRLDCVVKVLFGNVCGYYEELQNKIGPNLDKCWGVSFGGRSRQEEIHVKLYINENTEKHILNRLDREGRGGQVMRIRRNVYLYSGTFFDTNEMLSWLKTFTGRILDVQGTNEIAVGKLVNDWERMYRMYCDPESASEDILEKERNNIGDVHGAV